MRFRNFLGLTALAASLAFLSAIVIGAGPTRADEVRLPSFQCSLGASLGVANVAHTVASMADLGDSALMISPEIGCSFRASAISHGAVLRYDIGRNDAAIMGATLREDHRLMALYRIGFDLNPGAHLYGVAGMAWTNFKVPEASLKDSTRGFVLGVGLDLDIGKGPLSAFAEYDHVKWRDADLGGTSVKSDDNIIRAGIRYHFGR